MKEIEGKRMGKNNAIICKLKSRINKIKTLYLERAWSDNNGQTPVVTVIDGNDDVVLRKQVHFVGPAAHYFVSLFGAFRRG